MSARNGGNATDLTGQNKRRYPRRNYRRGLGLLHQGVFEVVRGHEVGEGGMMIETKRQLATGDGVVCAFFIPERGMAVARGEVVYLASRAKNEQPILEGPSAISSKADSTTPDERAHRFGLRFTTIEFLHRRKIREYVSEKTVDEVAV